MHSLAAGANDIDVVIQKGCDIGAAIIGVPRESWHHLFVGSSGIKRRKPKRRLRPIPRGPIDDFTPGHVTWPEEGSGFEASPWSPAGRAQQAWIWAGNARRYPRSLPLWPLVAVPAATLVIVGVGAALIEVLKRLV